MGFNKHILLMLVFVCFLILWGGCNPREFCPMPEDMDFEEIAPLSKNLEADIYIDASFSMVGFIKPGNSYYVRGLQMLERAFIAGWPKGSRNFYKFGSNISEISRDKALKAASEIFYCDPNFRGQTRIENVIDNANRNNLSVIITDLFQTDADVNLLIEKLNSRFLTKDIAVGVLGIKSQFNGRVWDVGLEDLNFDYYSNGREVAEYRPFYLLMFGKYNDIVHYHKMMKINGLNNFPEKNFIIFSSQLVERLASFDNARLSDTDKITEVLNILHPVRNYRHLKQFMVKGSVQKAYFDTVVKISFLSHMPKINSKKLKPEITAWQWQENPINDKGTHEKGKKISRKKLVICAEALRSLIVKDFKLSGSQLNFRTEIHPKNFPCDGTYCFRIVFQPLSEFYLLPKWISDWDMDQDLIYQWQKSPNQFKGNTTLNLKNFLNNIWQIIYQKNKPMIANFYCYIKKK